MKTATIKCGVFYALLDDGTVHRNIPGTGLWEQEISLIPEARAALGIERERPRLVIRPSGGLDRIWTNTSA
jgi:hypothetical protein